MSSRIIFSPPSQPGAAEVGFKETHVGSTNKQQQLPSRHPDVCWDIYFQSATMFFGLGVSTNVVMIITRTQRLEFLPLLKAYWIPTGATATVKYLPMSALCQLQPATAVGQNALALAKRRCVSFGQEALALAKRRYSTVLCGMSKVLSNIFRNYK